MRLLYSFANDTKVTLISSYAENGKTSNADLGGAFFYNGCSPCIFVAGANTPATANSGVSKTESHNECGGSSYSQKCITNGCSTGASFEQKEIGDVLAPVSSTTISEAITCALGLNSTQVTTQDPYTGKATAYCITDKTKGTVSFGGTYQKEPVFSCAKHPVHAVAIPGYGIPLSTKKGNELTYKVGCEEEPPFYVVPPPEYWDTAKFECSKHQYYAQYYQMPKCDYFRHFSKAGKYIKSSADLAGFSSYIDSIASGQTLTINSETKAFGTADTFNYTNKEVTDKLLSADYNKLGSFTYLYIDKSQLKSGSYNAWTGQWESTTQKFFGSEKVDCTYTDSLIQNPPCATGPDSKKTTVTQYAGTSWVSECGYAAGVPVGDFFANDILTATRTSALTFVNFDYTLSITNDSSSQTQNYQDTECVYQKEIKKPTVVQLMYAFPCSDDPNEACYEGPCPPQGTDYGAALWPGETFDKFSITVNCGFGCGGKSSECASQSTYNIWTSQKCQTTECAGPGPELRAPFVPCDGYSCLGSVPGYEYEYEDVTVKQQAAQGNTCDVGYTMQAGQSVTHRIYEQTAVTAFAGKIYRKAIQPFGIYVNTGKKPEWVTTFSIADKIIQSSHIVPHVFTPAKYGFAYAPPASGVSITTKGQTTFIAFSTASSNPNSYLVSSSTAKEVERAHWDGFGMFRGPFKSSTFEISFSGVKSNTIAEDYSMMAYKPFAQQTFVCDGGLNIIRSRSNSTAKTSSTTQTKAFSTSFDSTFDGFFSVKNIPFYSCTTFPQSYHAGFGLVGDQGGDEGEVSESNCVETCVETGVNEIIARLNTIKETSTYFIQGDESKLYQQNSISYFWTDPAKYQVYGTGHGTTCP